MTLQEAIEQRHSVRSYEEKHLADEAKQALEERIAEINEKSGLHIQLVTDEPAAFSGFMAHYGNFSGVTNYIAMIGHKDSSLDEKCGYYGEQLVLLAQQLGLNTCWVALTYSKIKSAYKINDGEKLCIVIALGYGKTQGTEHKGKSIADVSNADENSPQWFVSGVKAALLAPTAINQQQFRFMLGDGKISFKSGRGPCTKIDAGIVKYHFELGSGKKGLFGM